MRRSSMLCGLLLAIGAAALCLPAPVAAQDFFIPGQPKAGAPGAAPARPAPAAPARRPQPAPPVAGPRVAEPSEIAPLAGPAEAGGGDAAQVDAGQPALPPEPELPPLDKGKPPPAAVIGVMGVPEVMRASAAATQIEKTIGERRQRLNEDAQKEQGAWRDMQQALVNDRAKLSPDQIRARERELQERITNSQRQFRERGRVIQLAAQYALAQIERTLVSVIRQVADSRGMNLVLHRQQVALNDNAFDITDQVAAQMNKVLTSVVIPPDGVVPPTLPPATAQNAPARATAVPASASDAPATGGAPAPAPKP